MLEVGPRTWISGMNNVQKLSLSVKIVPKIQLTCLIIDKRCRLLTEGLTKIAFNDKIEV
jgi:hypothetical protein